MAAAYFLAAKVGLSLAVIHPSISAVWPPSAIGLGAMLLFGSWCWPGVFAGAFLINLQMALSGADCGFVECVVAAAGMGLGNTLEGAFGAWAVERFAGGRRAIERASDMLMLTLLAGLVGTLISATLGIMSLRAVGMLAADAEASAWLTWWLGDASAILIGTPLILAWCADKPQKYRGGLVEAAALTVLLTVIVWFVFFGGVNPIAYHVIPVLVWAAFRFGTRGASLAVFVLSLSAVMATVSGRGSFALGRGVMDLLVLQGFLATIAVSSFVMASLVWERERGEEELVRSRDRLEAEISRRTKELLQS